MSLLSHDQKHYSGVRFAELNGTEQTFSDVLFDDCEFINCDFTGAIWNACKLNECRFSNCNFSLVDISRSQFRSVEFEDCKILGVNWTKAEWPSLSFFRLLSFQRCIVNDSSFFGLNLAELVLQECRAHHADFRGCDLHDANLSYTDFASSLFDKTNLTGADLTEAINYDIDIYSNDISKAKFSRYEALRLLHSLNIELVG